MRRLAILYSFRRCPYAMRARLALAVSGTAVELREVKLANKPPALLAASPKGTVPVLQLPGGAVVDESIDIMRWALTRHDPQGWLAGDDTALIARIDGPFKYHLDRYKYPNRYDADNGENCDPLLHRGAGLQVLRELDGRLGTAKNLCGDPPTLTDMAIFPFIRQFANHDRTWFDGQELPRLQAWLERHLTSEIFARVMGKYQPWKAGDAPLIWPESHEETDLAQV